MNRVSGPVRAANRLPPEAFAQPLQFTKPSRLRFRLLGTQLDNLNPAPKNAPPMGEGRPSRQTRIGALRTLVGFALMPPSAAIIAVPLYAVMYAAGLLPQGAPIDSLDSALGLGAGVAFLAVVITVFCAIPAVNWLDEHRLLSLQRLLALGAVLGNLPFILIVVVIVAVQMARGNLSADVGQYWYGLGGAVVRVGIGTIVGVGSALILWLVAVDDNDSWDTRGIASGRGPVRRPQERRNDAPPDEVAAPSLDAFKGVPPFRH